MSKKNASQSTQKQFVSHPALTPMTPSQKELGESLKLGLERGSIVSQWTSPGLGSTTVMRALHAELGGAYLSSADFTSSVAAGDPHALEEAFQRMISEAILGQNLVFVDDWDRMVAPMCDWQYPRRHFIENCYEMIGRLVDETGCRLIIKGQALRERALTWGIEKFTPDDYKSILSYWFGAKAAALDYAKVHRFAPNLNGHHLRQAALWLRGNKGRVTTEILIDYIQKQRLASNVQLSEVQPVTLDSLVGVDEVVRRLEEEVVLPLENDHLAQKYKLTPKQGVLLFGPPGTGKTTVGRALAHRLKGKFLKIDGTFISGADDFYRQVDAVFETAHKNAPSVVFIDDADAIFENREERGLYRYLLTKLDGLETGSGSPVCVMMTAMKVSDLPAALVRSGRIEVWLKMDLPDEAARRLLLQRRLSELPSPFHQVDLDSLASTTEGLTGADLKRLVSDASSLCAADIAARRRVQTGTSYLQKALTNRRQQLSEHEAATQERTG